MHVMVDLETYGLVAGCAIRSIGATTFELGQIGVLDGFYENITDASNTKVGLVIDEETKKWWATQPEAEKILLENQKPLPQVLQAFTRFFVTNGCKYIWSHGAAFDVPLLWAAYHTCGLTVPWHYQNVLDTRTVLYLFGKPDYDLTMIKHYALDDAKYQANLIQRALTPRWLING